MWQRIVLLFLAAFLLGILSMASAEMKFTRVQCDILRPGVGIFEECLIKAISRKKNVLTIRFLLKEQVKKSFIRIAFVKRANGWKTFLYNFTFNACEFMNHPKKYPIVYYIYIAGRHYTDVNHSCPYEAGSYMTLKNLELFESRYLSFMPLEVGEYGLQTVWHINKEPAAAVSGYINYKDYRKF